MSQWLAALLALFPPAAIEPPCLYPPVCEIYRFPPARTARKALGLNQKWRGFAEYQAAINPRDWPEWDDALHEGELRYNTWNALDDAWLAKEDGREADCRECLENLKTRLGPEKWQAGEMPFPIPEQALWGNRD